MYNIKLAETHYKYNRFETMSRRRAAHYISAPQPSSVLVEAVLELAQMDMFSGCWRTMDDVARIIHAVYELPTTMVLTAEHLQTQLSKDACTASSVDSRDVNSTGIFRDHYQTLLKEQSTKKSRKVRSMSSWDLSAQASPWSEVVPRSS